MKFLLFLFSFFIINPSADWLTDFEQAQKIATEKNEPILLNFSGSDWCGPCIMLKKEVFETAEFKNFATNNLVLVNADFPRYKKNKLSSQVQYQNKKLAEKYNDFGKFPYSLLLKADGQVIKTWDGYTKTTPGEFIKQIKAAVESAK